MPLIASAVVGGLGAAYKIGDGISNEIKANRLEKNNRRPVFNIEDEYFQNRDIAANAAQHGLSEDAINFQRTNSERGLSTSLGAMLETGAGIGGLSELNDSFNRNLLATSAADSEARTNKLQFFVDNNASLAGQKTQKWVLNEYEPYKDTAQAIAQMRGAGRQNIATGIGEMGGALAGYSTAMDNQIADVNRQVADSNEWRTPTKYVQPENRVGKPTPLNPTDRIPLLYKDGGAVVPPYGLTK